MEKKTLERLNGAIFRTLSQSEARKAGGGWLRGTQTACSLDDVSGKRDGDLFEC